MFITAAQGCRLRNDLYCVEWDVKLYYIIPYHAVRMPIGKGGRSCCQFRCGFISSNGIGAYVVGCNCWGYKNVDALGRPAPLGCGGAPLKHHSHMVVCHAEFGRSWSSGITYVRRFGPNRFEICRRRQIWEKTLNPYVQKIWDLAVRFDLFTVTAE